MEPVTHILTGAVIARAGFNRKAAYATAAMAIAAQFPDVNTVMGFLFGPVAGFQHHRGITHTFAAVPFEAAFVTLCFYGAHRLRKRPQTKASPHWGWLYAGTLVALLSHLLLDWTNNYGLRPFFPFDPRWYAGSFVFIFEPVLFLLLLGALVMPSLFALINSEVGAKRKAFIGRGWAIAALVGIAGLYLFRFNEHAKALKIARENGPADAGRVFASPYPVNPFHWHAVVDSPGSYLLMNVNTRTGLADPPDPSDTVVKPAADAAIEAAKQTALGRAYLDWSSFPVVSESPDSTDPNHPLTAVTFADARFFYNVSLFHGRPTDGPAPVLSGTVLLDMAAPGKDRVVETRMNGKVQK